MTSSEEEFAYKVFQGLHSQLPLGEKSESPDFIFTTENNKRIGIELTELMKETSQLYTSASRYALEDKIAKSAQRQYDQLSHKRITVTLKIIDNLRLSSSEIDLLGEEIANILNNTLKDITYTLSYHHEIIENIPKYILGIYYDISPYLDESHFSVMRGKWRGSFNLNDLNRAISKKAISIPLYKRKVDSIYLLIVEGLTFSSYLGPFEFTGSILDNEFNKIYLIKIMSRQLYEIKKKNKRLRLKTSYA